MIDCPTRLTSSNTSTLIDYILTNTEENISQSGIIDTAISDHSLKYCTRKIPKAKYDRQKEITFRSLKNYLPRDPGESFISSLMKKLTDV